MEEETRNLHVDLKVTLINRAKAKAAILNLSLKDYIANLIEVNTADISEKIKKV